MTWTQDGNTLSHDSGFVIIFEPFSSRFASKPFPLKSVVVDYQDRRWRGRVTHSVKKDRTGVDEFRLLQEAHDVFLKHLRALNDPFPPD